jgi:hypothetical protein
MQLIPHEDDNLLPAEIVAAVYTAYALSGFFDRLSNALFSPPAAEQPATEIVVGIERRVIPMRPRKTGKPSVRSRGDS